MTKQTNGMNLSTLRVASILDQFSYECFKYECNLITFSPANWRKLFSLEKPHMLFVESAWKGNDGAWCYKIGRYNNQDQKDLFELIQWCKNNNIPTVFWNKEDPVHFLKFIDSAKLFDYIFTSDQNMIDKYRKIVHHNNIFPLPFAAQPKIHNPIKNIEEKEERLCFAGSYYNNRHESRRKDMEILLEVASHYGLDIYDRNYMANSKGNTHFSFPDQLRPYICGNLSYEEIYKAYKGYKILLNVNSIKDSPTMFSRRVFEVLASGTPIVSTYAKGIEEMLGKDIVFMGDSKKEYENAIEKLLTEKRFYDKICVIGLRKVLNHHTYTHRLMDVTRIVGLKIKEEEIPKVSVISIVEDEDQFKSVLNNYSRQIYKNIELILIISHDELAKTAAEYIDEKGCINPNECKIFTQEQINGFHNMMDICTSHYISYFNFENYYGQNFLVDLVNANKYVDSEIIGKSSHFIFNKDKQNVEVVNSDNEYIYTTQVEPTACIIGTKLLKDIPMKNIDIQLKNMEIFEKLLKLDVKIFSIDKYNFVKGCNIYQDDVNIKENIIPQIII